MATFDSHIATLRRLATVVPAGGEEAANRMAGDFTDEVVRVLTSKAHPFATRTPSVAPEPPAMISGRLAGSMDTQRAVPVGGGTFVARSGPTIRYARIQELGGMMRGHPMMRWREDGQVHYSRAHSLPARPYMLPTLDRMIMSGDLGDAAARSFQVVISVAL
jgi:phage gpG-like protein